MNFSSLELIAISAAAAIGARHCSELLDRMTLPMQCTYVHPFLHIEHVASSPPVAIESTRGIAGTSLSRTVNRAMEAAIGQADRARQGPPRDHRPRPPRLEQFVVEAVATTSPLHRAILNNEQFIRGDSTRFMDKFSL